MPPELADARHGRVRQVHDENDEHENNDDSAGGGGDAHGDVGASASEASFSGGRQMLENGTRFAHIAYDSLPAHRRRGDTAATDAFSPHDRSLQINAAAGPCNWPCPVSWRSSPAIYPIVPHSACRRPFSDRH